MEKQLVILMAGKATRLAPLSYILPKGLMTINQKPACFNLIAEFVKNHEVNDITFVVSPTNEALVTDFAYKSFEDLKINIIVQTNPQGPLHAFMLCKDVISKPTILLLGDTLCATDLDFSYDWVGYKNIDDNSHSRWCLIKTDSKENVTEIIDKPDYTPETNKVLIGLYYFKNPEILRESLSKAYPKIRNEYQLSSMIEDYSKSVPMKGLLINSWFDTGTLKDYNETLSKNISGRSFNSFTLDEFGVLTKVSDYQKLKSEIGWYKQIKAMGLDFLTPAFYGDKVIEENGKELISYKIEFTSGNTMTEYFNYYKIAPTTWSYIFQKLLKTGSILWLHKPPKKFDMLKNAEYMYKTKTLERINKWTRKDILAQEHIVANGEKLMGFNKAYKILEPKINKLIASSPKYAGIIHGDMCFSNIIFFPQAGTFKFIDPRGNFGEDTIFGDYRYDVAKMRHNYHGLYDYITLSLFKLNEISPSEFSYKFFTHEMLSPQIFDEELKKWGKVNIEDIELIEGLLFISMIPLHADNKEAQIMYYITGLKCLNNLINKEQKL